MKYVNKLFSSGSYTTEWTKAIIGPLHKKDDINDVDNDREMSVLNVLSKVFTHIVNRRLTEWVESNNVISFERSTPQWTTYSHCMRMCKNT